MSPKKGAGMKKAVAVFALVAALGLAGMDCAPAPAADGQDLFTDMGCVSCHKPDRKTAGSAVKDIAQAYGGDEAALLKFFRDESKPLVVPQLPASMAKQREKIKQLPEEDQKALAAYILSQQ
jgi:cytochrome c